MKKVFIAALAVLSLSLASCGGNKTNEVATSSADSTIVETSPANVAAQSVFQQLKEAANDPARLSLALGSAQAKIQQLLQNGDSNAVKEFTTILQDLIKGDTTVSDALAKAKTAVSGTNLLDAFNAVVGEATKEGATAKGFMEVAKKMGTSALIDQAVKAGALSDSVAAKAGEAVESAKEAAGAAVEGAKDAAAGAMQDAKDAAGAAAEGAKDAANKKIEEGASKAADAAKEGLKKIGL